MRWEAQAELIPYMSSPHVRSMHACMPAFSPSHGASYLSTAGRALPNSFCHATASARRHEWTGHTAWHASNHALLRGCSLAAPRAFFFVNSCSMQTSSSHMIDTTMPEQGGAVEPLTILQSSRSRLLDMHHRYRYRFRSRCKIRPAQWQATIDEGEKGSWKRVLW